MKSALHENDIFRFLMVAYFGDCKDVIAAASNRAYRDMCRTIDDIVFKKSLDTQRRKDREKVTSFIKRQIEQELPAIIIKNSQRAFDVWHKTTCQGIISSFETCGRLHYGQAQKWLNMTCKYLLVLRHPEIKKTLRWLHIAVDNRIIDMAQKQFSISAPSEPWSRWRYASYIEYQKKIRKSINNNSDIHSPFIWEFVTWPIEKLPLKTVLK